MKKTLVTTFFASLDLKELQSLEIIVLTPTGIISGIPLTKDNIEKNDLMSLTIKNLSDKAKEIYIKSNENSYDKDSFFLLKNAKIHNGSQIIDIKHVIIFYDQIVGISLGKLE